SHNFRRFVTEDGLISFGIDQAALYRLAASYVDRIQKARNQPTSRCKRRRNTKPCSTSRLPKHSAWKYRRVCLPMPTRRSNEAIAALAHVASWHKADIPDLSASGAKRTSASDCLRITIYEYTPQQ